jgi:hypothetical protein
VRQYTTRSIICGLIAALLTLEAYASFASPACRDLIYRISNISLDPGQGVVRPSFGLNSTTIAEKKHLQFGFESEYGLKEIDQIVEVYGPDESLGMSKEQWLAMTVSDRSQWVRDNLVALFPVSRQEGNFVRLVQEPEMDFLPERLIFDDTGNIEFIFKPFDTFEDWYQSVSKLNRRFGTGSMQGTISTPPDSFFGRVDGLDSTKVVDEKMGMFNYYLDYDIIQKLSAGAARYNNDNTQMVARNFEHPFLGPTTNKKQEILESTLRGNAAGEKYEADRMARIAGWENSFKYVGGTVYRPDILGQERVILEVRDAHKNFNLLTDRLLRALYFNQHGTQGLDQFKSLKSFDPDASFEKFEAPIKEELERLFPNKANPNYEYSAEIKSALDVFKNFAYPLRDWSTQIDAFGVPSLAQNIQQAQDAYKAKLSDLVVRLRQGQIDDEEAKRQIHGALANFVEESGVYQAFSDFEKNSILTARPAQNAAHVDRPSFGQFVEEATIEAGPLKSAFPERLWTGPLTERMEQLVAKYPQNIKKMPAVQIKFKENNGGKRDIYVISLNGLDEGAKEEFLKDYFIAISDKTLSFPLSESSGHLYSRIGNQSVDFFFQSNVAVNAYRLPNSPRLEAFIEFQPAEFMKMRTYIENGIQDGAALIGSRSYNGVTGETRSTLTNNRPLGQEGHNCTSWICTSPIGDRDEALHDLVRAQRSHEIHTNPGWWSMWLMNHAPRERVPFAILMDDKPLEEMMTTHISDNTLIWNFGTH